MGYPKKCDVCVREALRADMFNGKLQLSVQPFMGTSPLVMIVGQDPTLTKRDVDTVLELNKPHRRLYRYLVGKILEPAGIDLAKDIYATNLIKCRFPNNETPKVIAKKRKESLKDFLYPFFQNCKQWFVEEVKEIRPRIVLPLGQPVHQLLVGEWLSSVPLKMKDAFGNIYPIHLCDHEIIYCPSIHYNTRGHRYYKNLWSQFVANLMRTVDKGRKKGRP